MMTKAEIQTVRALQQKKFRHAFSRFVVEGRKMVDEMLESGWPCEEIYVTSAEMMETWQKKSARVRLVSRKEMDMMSALSTPSDVLAVAHEQAPGKIETDQPLWPVLDGIADPGNMGTIIRTCDWFGIPALMCSENCVELYNPKVVQATMGSLFRVRVHYASLHEQLTQFKTHGYTICGAVLGGAPLEGWKPQGKTVLVIGSESHGISKPVLHMLDTALAIGGSGRAESLNAAVAAAILLHHCSKNL